MENSIEKRIENYWDKRSRDFSTLRQRELAGENALSWRKLLEEKLPQGVSLDILDVGTGAGFFSIILAKAGHNLTGIDASDKMLAEAKKNAAAHNVRATFLKMDAQKLSFPPSCFDALVCRNLTWTLPDAMEAYRRWSQVLKPGGLLLNFDSDWGKLRFSKEKDQAYVHKNVNDELLEECNNIKDSLRISTHTRPAWDVRYLTQLGLEVEVEADVSPKVHRDKNIRYDSIPLFGIYGHKPL